MSKLAIFGGSPAVSSSFPSRSQITNKEKEFVSSIFDYYISRGIDFGVNGKYYKKYCNSFTKFIKGSGNTLAVNSGTSALEVIIRSISLPKSSEVLVSTVTDPGGVNSLFLYGFKPRLIDTTKKSYNPSLNEIKKAVTSKTKLILLSHIGGRAIQDIMSIARFCKNNNIILIEDASQAHGASVNGKMVGTFGDVSFFSTMFSKNHTTGSTGAVIYTESSELFNKLLSTANKGKLINHKLEVNKLPSTNNGPSLNFNLDEISCGIGLCTLAKLKTTNVKRVKIIQQIEQKLAVSTTIVAPANISDNDAPYFWPFELRLKDLDCTKSEFCTALIAEGVHINDHYDFIVADWPWASKYINNKDSVVNALKYRETSFNLLFNEHYKKTNINQIVKAILKVVEYYQK